MEPIQVEATPRATDEKSREAKHREYEEVQVPNDREDGREVSGVRHCEVEQSEKSSLFIY